MPGWEIALWTAIGTSLLWGVPIWYMKWYQPHMSKWQDMRFFRHTFGFNQGVVGKEETHAIHAKLWALLTAEKNTRRAMQDASTLVLATSIPIHVAEYQLEFEAARLELEKAQNELDEACRLAKLFDYSVPEDVQKYRADTHPTVVDLKVVNQ